MLPHRTNLHNSFTTRPLCVLVCARPILQLIGSWTAIIEPLTRIYIVTSVCSIGNGVAARVHELGGRNGPIAARLACLRRGMPPAMKVDSSLCALAYSRAPPRAAACAAQPTFLDNL